MNLKELNSFKLSDAVTFHDKLNPKLWNGTKLRPDVREQLLVIAQDFLEELGVHDLDVKDITISGSNAAYSYTKHSDLDLHILVDMGNLPVDEVYRELFTAKKTIYNDTHDIKINNIPVELYVQDSRQPVVSLGEYSVMNDQWIKIPTKRRSDFDQTATKSKYEKLLSLIEIALKSKKYSKVKHIIDTIKRYRQAGLDKGGEFGPENLAYKMLRSQGYITKLYDLRDKLHSEKLSFETMYQNIDEDEQFNNVKGVAEGRNNESPDHLVSEFLKSISPKELRYYTIRDNCGPAALHMKDWAEGKGIDLTRHEGYFVADTVVYDKADFTKEMKREFIEQGLDFNDPTARKQFIESNPKYSEEWKKIPHYWLQDKQGNIYDPTGYIQFVKTGLSSDLDKSRYKPIRQGVNENEKEQFNNELWKSGLDFKQDINGILYHVTNAGKKNDFLSIKAYDKRNPNPIGDAQFAKARNLYTGEVQGVTSMKTKVDPNYQGQGIAANMYALIRMLGVNILPSETQTNAGKQMWSKWRKQGDVNSLKDLDPKVKGVAEEYNTMQYASEKTPAINPYGGLKDNQFRGAMSEASGYIPSEKQKNDPRFKTALTVDVHPDSIKKNAKAFYWNTSRAGIPPTAKANGKI